MQTEKQIGQSKREDSKREKMFLEENEEECNPLSIEVTRVAAFRKDVYEIVVPPAKGRQRHGQTLQKGIRESDCLYGGIIYI